MRRFDLERPERPEGIASRSDRVPSPFRVPGTDSAPVFGWCSGVFAILLAANRLRFTAQPLARQRWQALAIWLAHVAALGLFIMAAVGLI